MVLTKFVLALCFISLAAAQTTPGPDIETVLRADGRFNTFVDLLSTSGYLAQINSTNRFTVFAPSDAAFSKLPAGTLDSLKADADKLKNVIGYHVVINSTFNLAQNQDRVLTSANNHSIRINTYSVLHTQTAEGVNITRKNVHVLHGIVHELDGIMTPPDGNIVALGTSRTDISTFESLIVKANLTTLFTSDHSSTIFAPNDDAFRKVNPAIMSYLSSHPLDLAEVLRYHFVKSYSLYSLGMVHGLSLSSADLHSDHLMILQDATGVFSVNQAKVVVKDISSINGVVHIIDDVLIPTRVMVNMADSAVIVG